MRRCVAFAIVVAFCTRADSGETTAKPFPVSRTQTVKDGVFEVVGRVRIPTGVEITIQKDTKIIGRPGESFIELEGKLTVQGVYGSVVVIDGVTVELQPKFVELNVNGAQFRGGSKGAVTPKDAACEGRIRIADSRFEDDATLNVTLTGSSSVDLRTTTYHAELGVKAVSAPGAKGSNVKLLVKACQAGRSGWPSGIRAEGLSTVEIRESEIGGLTSSFIDCGSVAIDSSYLFSRKLEFVQSAGGHYPKSQIQSCDLHCTSISLSAPEVAGNPERLKIENCWFGGETSVRTIREKFVTDHDDDPARGVVASVERVAGKPLQLNWTIQR